MKDHQTQDDSSLRRYRTEIPNILDDSDLDPFAFRLYTHYKRVAGDSGRCFQSVRTLAAACKMSVGSVSNARKALAAGKWIKIEIDDQGHETVIIRDVWLRNMKSYSRSSDEQISSKGVHGAVHESVHQVNNKKEHKKEPEEETHSARAREGETAQLPEPAFDAARSEVISKRGNGYRQSAAPRPPKVDPFLFPDRVVPTPELLEFAAKHGYEGDDLRDCVESMRMKRLRDGKRYKDDKELGLDIQYWITNCASNRRRREMEDYA